jgi:hypothetical protein
MEEASKDSTLDMWLAPEPPHFRKVKSIEGGTFQLISDVFSTFLHIPMRHYLVNRSSRLA